jgi:hypothetical protein
MQTLRIAHTHTHYRLDLSWWRAVSWAQVAPDAGAHSLELSASSHASRSGMIASARSS